MDSNAHALRVEAIRQHVTIFEVLDRMGHTVPEQTGQIRCPFHDDHSPSARVYADQNKVYCFTEQKVWDVVAAVQEWRKLGFADALTFIEQEFSVPGVQQGLVGTLRRQLSRPTPAPVAGAAQAVEQRLIAARRTLGYERYTRLLLGLDVSVWEVAQGTLRPEDFRARLVTLLAGVP